MIVGLSNPKAMLFQDLHPMTMGTKRVIGVTCGLNNHGQSWRSCGWVLHVPSVLSGSFRAVLERHGTTDHAGHSRRG